MLVSKLVRDIQPGRKEPVINLLIIAQVDLPGLQVMPDDLTIPTITNGCRVNKPGFEKTVCANQIDFQPFIQEILFISKQADVVSFLRVWLSIHIINLRIVLYLLLEAGTEKKRNRVGKGK